MAETEAGWTKEFPTVSGMYWARWRSTVSQNTFIVEVIGNRFYMVGRPLICPNDEVSVPHEWLGPLSPSDAEHLIELRKAATVALTWMDWWLNSELCECDGYGHVCGKPERRKEADQLRSVLNPKQPGKETK